MACARFRRRQLFTAFRRLAGVRALLITLAWVILSALLVTLMADGAAHGLFRPVQSASIGLIDR
jgi:hypothetical protein